MNCAMSHLKPKSKVKLHNRSFLHQTQKNTYEIPAVLLPAAVLPPLAAPLPGAPAGFVGDVLPRARPAGALAAVVAAPREGVVPPLPLAAAPRPGK